MTPPPPSDQDPAGAITGPYRSRLAGAATPYPAPGPFGPGSTSSGDFGSSGAHLHFEGTGRAERIKDSYAAILDEIAPGWQDSPHLQGTPERIAKMWAEFIDYDPGTLDTTFPVENVDQLVAVRGIKTHSFCAHHLLPFYSVIDIGYLADDHVLGLSKFARIAHLAARKLTTQEQVVADIADHVTKITGSPDVAVIARGEHQCMTMRGIRTPATMITSVTRGAFRDKPEARAEWLALIDGHG